MMQLGRITRRHLLTAAAAGTTALSLSTRSQAKMASGLPQAPYFYRFKLGSAECTIVSDGQLPLGDPNAAFLVSAQPQLSRVSKGNLTTVDRPRKIT